MYYRLASLLTLHRSTQKDLAEFVGISPNTLSKKMKGKIDWVFTKEVVPIVKFFRSFGSTYTVEEIFEEGFK